MRTLKKALSLVLVLAMVFALAVPGFAADTTKKATSYKDYSKVTNTEAVDVLTAIGVLHGNTDGTFGPEGNFTRAEAATLITYLTLGKTVADALPNTTCKFADVPAWAAKYVQYCANEGIVVGYDAKTFGANDPLTAAQWALMLLKAAGAKGVEEINASNFALATTKLAISTGLATADDMAATFNRDAAAKLALNGLFYSETTTEKEVYKIDVTTDADNSMAAVKSATYATFSEAYLVAKEAANSGDVWTVKSTKTQVKTDSLADKVFKLSCTESTDTLGRKVNTYASTLKTLKDLNLVETAQADYVIDGKITSAKLYSTVGYKVAGYTWTNKTDGTNNSGTGAAAANYAPVSTATSDVFGNTANGTTTYIYINNDAKTVTSCTVNTYVGEVKKVTAAKDGVARFVTLTNGKTFTTDSFAVKDVVLYTVGSDSKVVSMELANVVTGKLTKIATTGTAKTYTVNGTAYAESANAVTGSGFTTANINKEVSFYVDAQGNLIMNKSAAATETNFIFVLANSATKTGDYMTGAVATVDVYGVTNAGEVVTLTADNIDGALTTTSPVAANAKANTLFTYTKNSNGNYSLTAVTSPAATADITKNATTVEYGASDKAVMNSATQYIFITQETNSKTVKNVQTITGNANIATIDVKTTVNGTDYNHAFVAAENGVAKYIFVNTAAATAVTDTTKVVYVNSSKVTTGVEYVDGKETTTYTYANAWTVDGKLANGIVGKTNSLSGLFYINDDNTIGTAISTTTGVITAINGNVVTVKPSTGAAVAYNITDKTAEIFAGEDVELKVGQTVAVKANGTTASNLDVIVVTGDQDTVTFALGTVSSGYTATTTTYELVKGTGVANTVKVTVTGNLTSASTVTLAGADTAAHTLTAAEKVNGSVTLTYTFTAPTSNVTANVTVA